ncbi:hypothetical protein CEXT_808501 [Caerostris extrusa]|uniref:Uncharacterized protein n=1 Tax=Caerostris extrusa TaxID=172846 RepID=A0AAV4S514_CAEEX|nr:hypothetical protein CEXT_808501 [Caerostris extrusa]
MRPFSFLWENQKIRQTALLNNKCRWRELSSVCHGRENLSLFIMAVRNMSYLRDLSETKGLPMLIQIPQLQMEILVTKTKILRYKMPKNRDDLERLLKCY